MCGREGGGLGSGPAVAREALFSRADDGLDHAGPGIDPTYPVGLRVPKVEISVRPELQPKGIRDGGFRRGPPIPSRGVLAGPDDRPDDAGSRLDDADAVIAAVSQVEVAVRAVLDPLGILEQRLSGRSPVA